MPKRGFRSSELRAPRYGGFTRSDGTRYFQAANFGTIKDFSTGALAANEVLYMPYWSPSTLHVDQLSINVTSAGVASTTARMGIYHADGDWQPTALIVDGGAVAVDATGQKNATVDVVLDPGPYLLAVNTDGAPTLTTARSGFWMSFDGSWSTNQPRTIFAVQTFGALPDPGDQWTSHRSGANGFEVFVFPRVA